MIYLRVDMTWHDVDLLIMFLYIDKLYWVADSQPPTNIHNAFFFNIDNVSSFLQLFTMFSDQSLILAFENGVGSDIYAVQQRFRSSQPLYDTPILSRAAEAAQVGEFPGVDPHLPLHAID